MSFEDILGQAPAVRILKRIIRSGRIAGSYIFIGPESVGKKTTAVSFAMVLNCEKKKGDSCGECRPCRAIGRGNFGDLIVLEPAGPIQSHHIETIRQVQDFVNLRSFHRGWKVVIIDEADRMTEEAAASLLKILEEPPPNTVFILITSRPENIFRTVLSRCQTIRFLPLSRDIQCRLIERYLKRGKNTGTRDIDGVISLSRGGLKKAIELLTPDKKKWRKEILNWRDSFRGNIFSISQNILRGDNIRQDFVMDILHLLFTSFRDILFLKEGVGNILNMDYEDQLRKEAARLDFLSIWNSLQAIIYAQRDIMRQASPRLVLDTLFLTLVRNQCMK